MIRMFLTIFAALSLSVFPEFTACSPDDAPFSGTERPDTPGGGDPGVLGLQHDVVDLLHLLGGLAHGDGAGHVGAVAVVQAAEIHGDKVARGAEFVRSSRVVAQTMSLPIIGS